MVKGTVTRIRQNGRFYSMLVDEVWYGLGSNKPNFSEGAMIQFEYTENGDFKNATSKTITVLGAGNGSSGSSAPRPQASSARVVHANEKDDYWKKKEERDVTNDRLRNIGAGRNTAIAFVDLLIKANALKLPAKESAKADAMFEAVEYYRIKFENANSDESVGSLAAVDDADADNEADNDYE